MSVGQQVDKLIKNKVKFELVSYGDETYCLTSEDNDTNTHKWDNSLVDLENTIKSIPIPKGIPLP